MHLPVRYLQTRRVLGPRPEDVVVEQHARAATLVAKLRADGVLRSARIEQALLNVPRQVFTNWLDHDEAYSDTAHAIPGTTVDAPATISQPRMIVQVLETAQPFPGARVLEIGTGTGYFAALMAHLVGPQGSVDTIEIETALVALAQRNLEYV